MTTPDHWSHTAPDRDLVDALLEIGHGLTEWETGFAESLGAWVIGNTRKLTPKQRATATRILEEKESP